jgi:uncharacterized protein YjbJ (UPF0337 family)
MAERESGPGAAAKGIVEEVKGRAKEAAGALTGNDRLQAEGAAQQGKAEAEREVATKEAEAEAARSKARGKEAEQRANQ